MEQQSPEIPFFSIVTIVYNGEAAIENTILSCLGQNYDFKEYIVIDGASTDNTFAIIERHKANISYILSEPDHGIYDAMNKAIQVASGNWIIFINCGDLFCNDNVLMSVADFLQNGKREIDVLYGNTFYSINNLLMHIKPLPLVRLEREMAFCHQSTFVKINLIKKNPFDLSYQFAADYNMMFRFYKQKRRFCYIDQDISIFNQNDGSSLRNYKQSTKERFSIHSDHGTMKNTILLNKTLCQIQIAHFIKKLIPSSLNKKLFCIKNRHTIVQNTKQHSCQPK